MEKAYENMGANAKRYKNLQACYSTKLASSAVMDHSGYCRIDNYLNLTPEDYYSCIRDINDEKKMCNGKFIKIFDEYINKKYNFVMQFRFISILIFCRIYSYIFLILK